MLEGEVEKLWSSAKANPRATLSAVTAALKATVGPGATSWLHAAAGRAHFELGENSAAISSFEEALDTPMLEFRERVLVSLAAALSASGRSNEAREHLAVAARTQDPAVQALAQSQLGLIELHNGNVLGSLALLKPAIETLSQLPEEAESYARAVGNAGYCELLLGKLDAAIERFELAGGLAARSGQTTVVAGCAQNIGYALMRQGDLPKALNELERARGIYRSTGDPGRNVSTLLDDLAETYRIAGLTDDAVATAQEAVDLTASGDNREKQVDALFRLARCQLDAGDASAVETAKDAAELFETAGRTQWVRRSHLFRVEALAELGTGKPPELLAIVEELGTSSPIELEERTARNVVALEFLRTGSVDKARRALGSLDNVTGDESVIAQIEAQLTDAIAAACAGESLELRADAATSLIRDHAHRLADPELRAGAIRLMNRLRRLFVGHAIDRGDADAVFRFEERFRANSLSLPRVTSINDAAMAAMSQELRDLARSLDTPGEHLEAEARIGSLESDLRRRSLQLSRSQLIAPSVPHTPTSVASVASNRHVVEWIEADNSLWAITFDDGTAAIERCCGLEEADTRATQIRVGLARLARPGLTRDAKLRRWERLREDCRELAAALFSAQSHNGGWVLSPPNSLADLPWSLVLESDEHKSITIVPSVSWWLTNQEKQDVGLSFRAVAGPGLVHARSESERLTKMFDGPHPPATRVIDAHRAISQASLLHVASHGAYRPDSPRFSSLRLDDGPLSLHEIDQAEHIPAAVVLAACDVGRHTSVSGGELLGFAPTWLAAGTRSVVAPVCAVSDAGTTELMRLFYEALTTDMGMATALRHAQAQLESAPSEVRAAAHAFVNVGCDTKFVSTK